MKHALKSKSKNEQSSARVVDGKLILSFPGAINPVVWQMDLTEAKSSALEVREGKAKDSFALCMRSTNDEVTEIAPFENRDDAVAGLMAASEALENAQGQIRPVGGVAPSTIMDQTIASAQKQTTSSKVLPIVLGLLLVIVLFGVWASMSMRLPMNASITNTTAATTSQPLSPNDTGVPISADDFLKGR